MIKAAIVGATGYVGRELIKLLHLHQEAELTCLSAKVDKDRPIEEEFPQFRGEVDLVCHNFESASKIAEACDVVFLALPHTVSMKVAPQFLNLGKRVIDLSADFRLKQAQTYKEWYGTEHSCPELLKEAVYGLPELYAEQIKGANLIANPGCYPTSAILGLAPLLKEKIVEPDFLIIDAKSGVSGAGREPSLKAHFPERNESLAAYSVGSHRHIPEIEQELSQLFKQEIRVSFVPHLIPMNRGILSTIYLRLTKDLAIEELWRLYQDFYASSHFVRLIDTFPETKDVSFTNYCDLTLRQDKRSGQVVILSVIDNLIKGAAGQAVQNMNLMYGLDERMGLRG